MNRDFITKIKSIYASNESTKDGFYQLYAVLTERFGAPILVNSVDRLCDVVRHLISLSEPGEVLDGQFVKLVFIGYFDAFDGSLMDVNKVYYDLSELEVS